MVCRECQHANKDGEQLCSRCGLLLGSDHIVKRVRRKLSQLAQFGLAGTRRPLLKR
jgi:predicted amidophosphoribosyltransferase